MRCSAAAKRLHLESWVWIVMVVAEKQREELWIVFARQHVQKSTATQMLQRLTSMEGVVQARAQRETLKKRQLCKEKGRMKRLLKASQVQYHHRYLPQGKKKEMSSRTAPTTE
jgi:hypothetical protein